jgi:hypothetical protein
MSERWHLEIHGGAGVFQPGHGTGSSLQTTPSYVGGATAAFKMRTHTFVAGVDRSISYLYGYGPSKSSSATFGWVWRLHPNAGWALMANGSAQQIDGIGAPNIHAWQANAGMSRSLPGKTTISVMYAYLFTGSAAQLATPKVTGWRVAWMWTPTRMIR